jgi:hypothetical protein
MISRSQPVDGLWKGLRLFARSSAAEPQAVGQRPVKIRLEAFFHNQRLRRRLRIPQVDVKRLDLLDQEQDRSAGGA